ncbi:MAG: DUF2079 domain-containing protein [Chloroflexi bacterium]|nr:DUF2079 domain-containing protein [Chloroflexota bacterium]
MPVGLHSTVAEFEEWQAVELISNRRITEFVPTSRPPTRPLLWLPHVIAYYLSPDSHVGYNMYLITLFVMRGAATFFLVRQVLKSTMLGLAVAGLYLVYPADIGWFTFRAITVQTSLVLGLFSLYFLSLYWDRPRRWLWPFILGTQILSLLHYEFLYLVFGLAPLLLIGLEGELSFSRRLVRVSLLWYSTYSILMVRFLHIIATGQGDYVNERLNSNTDNRFPEKAITGVFNMYSNHLDGWVTISDEYVVLSLAIGLIVAIVVGWLMQHRYTENDVLRSRKHLAILLVVSLLLMLVTYVQYIFVEAADQTFRVYFVPSLGAALFVVIGLYGLSRLSRLENVLFPLCIGIFMFVGAQKAIEQNTYYANQSIRIQRLLSSIVAEVPQPVQGSVIVVVDEQELYQTADALAGRSDHLQTALSYLYGDDVEAVLCVIDPQRLKICEFTADKLVETSITKNYVRRFPYEDLIIFNTRWDGTIELLDKIPVRYYDASDITSYAPQRLIQPDAELPHRAYTFFTCWPFDQCDPLSIEAATPVDSVHVDFGKTVPGGGWLQFRARSIPSRVIVARAATLEFLLVPDQDYHLHFITSIVEPELADRLVVEVNDQPIPVKYMQDNERLVFSSEGSFYIDNEVVTVNFRSAGDDPLRDIRFFSLDMSVSE